MSTQKTIGFLHQKDQRVPVCLHIFLDHLTQMLRNEQLSIIKCDLHIKLLTPVCSLLFGVD